jgi:hypothetical protein
LSLLAYNAAAMRFRLLLPILCCLPIYAQQQTPSDNPPPKPAAPSVSATTRLLNAKTIFLKNVVGSDIPLEIVSNAVIGWPRYTVVDALEKADLLIEVSSPEPPKKKEDGGGAKIQSGAGGRDPRALPPPTTSSNSLTDVKLVVRDAHTKAILWAGSEPAKEAFRQAKTDENLVEATQKLVRKLHDRVEPPEPPQ